MLTLCLQLDGKVLLILAAAYWTLILAQQPPPVLPYISLGSTAGVQREYIGHFDDGVSHAIHIPGGFPFGNLIHSFAYVETNGMITFSEPIYTLIIAPFPDGAPGAYVVAPYCDDVDIRLAGDISYEVHSRIGNNPGSNQLLDEVSGFVEASTGQSFQGSWMLIAEWKEVHPWPHGSNDPLLLALYPERVLNNTWQGLVIMDGTNSYTVFTYRCGDMTWTSHHPVIGFNAAGSSFVNHFYTGSRYAEGIACLNTPDSQWYNLVYQISLSTVTSQISLPTIEPTQSSYLSFLEFTNSTATSGTLPPCDNCTVAVTVPGNGFPFGSYYHSTVYVSTNGVFSFGEEFHLNFPKPFHLTDVIVHYSHLIAPYWSNIDTRLDGHVNYEVHVSGESSTSDDYLGRVSSLINSEAEDPDFIGSWMIVATWDSVHPFPHGSSAEQDRVDPYLQSTNTFQGILITNGTQSYSVFTYECDLMEWSDEAIIGYNTGGEFHASHPLSGNLFANAIDCVHSNINITVNNVIYNITFKISIDDTPPPPDAGSCVVAGYHNCCTVGLCLGYPPTCSCHVNCAILDICCPDVSITCPDAGSCAAAGYRTCCTDGYCEGSTGDCYCDHICHEYGDCCHDKLDLCPIEVGPDPGSCIDAGYTACCTNEGSDCSGEQANCKCDAECRDYGDCCDDIVLTCPLEPHPTQTVWLPYLSLQTTSDVVTFTVPRSDDGHSPPIFIPVGFPIGNEKLYYAFVGTNGVISFQEAFTHHTPYPFPSSNSTFISSAFLLAPYWSNIDVTVYGSIAYEIHNQSNPMLLSQVSNFISNYTNGAFTGTWMLVVHWNEVVEVGTTDPTNTFQAIAITDGSRSYAVYTYRCGDLEWSDGTTIGYNGGPVGDFYANHPFSGVNAKHIDCLNFGVLEWSNVVYNVSCDVCIPTEPPPPPPPLPDVYLEFLERTSSSITMRRCDDCASGVIDSTIPVPFGEHLLFDAYISTNGVISFGHPFSHYGATLFPNEGDPTVYTSFLAAPYWGDIDNRNLGEIWYDTHTSGQSEMSNSLLESVSNFVRSEQNLSSFQGIWMVVATWNGSVPFAGTGEVRNTFQGIVITNGSKTYAVYTYHCDDMQWSDGSVIGFNAGGSYYVNHPLSDSFGAQDIDCVHSPGLEWNNVIYDLTPNGGITAPTPLERTSEPITLSLTSTQPTAPPTTLLTISPTTLSETPPTTPLITTTIPPTTLSETPPTLQPTTPSTGPTVLPTKVADLSAVAPRDSDTEFIVSWGLPERLDSDGNGYRYHVMVTNYSLDFVASKTLPVNMTSTSITGLRPYIPYNITVIIHFTSGDGPPTSILNFTRQGVPPVSPSNIKVEKIDSGAKLRVSWDLLTPEEARGFVTDYIVSYRSESRKRQTSEKIVPGTESSTIIEGLDPNQEYSVVVRADTKAGKGETSEPVSTISPTTPNVGAGRASVSGATAAGGLIAVAVAMILVAMVILFAVWVIKKKNGVKDSQLLKTDLVLENKASTCTHTTIDGAPSYNNPLYEADGVGPSPTYEEIKPSPCENPISKNSFKID